MTEPDAQITDLVAQVEFQLALLAATCSFIKKQIKMAFL